MEQVDLMYTVRRQIVGCATTASCGREAPIGRAQEAIPQLFWSKGQWQEFRVEKMFQDRALDSR